MCESRSLACSASITAPIFASNFALRSSCIVIAMPCVSGALSRKLESALESTSCSVVRSSRKVVVVGAAQHGEPHLLVVAERVENSIL